MGVGTNDVVCNVDGDAVVVVDGVFVVDFDTVFADVDAILFVLGA